MSIGVGNPLVGAYRIRPYRYPATVDCSPLARRL